VERKVFLLWTARACEECVRIRTALQFKSPPLERFTDLRGVFSTEDEAHNAVTQFIPPLTPGDDHAYHYLVTPHKIGEVS
jgi:hypothetical protein